MTESPSSLLPRYRELAARHAATDFGDRASVRRGNAASNQMRKLAARVAAGGPAAADAFAVLLNDPGPVRSWAAHHVLELMAPAESTRRRALAVIEERARGEDVIALGEQLSLRDWYATHLEDRSLTAPAV